MYKIIIDTINKIPGEVWLAMVSLIVGLLAHKRFNLQWNLDRHKENEKQRRTWFEVELEYVNKNQDLLQQSLDKAIERLEKDRDRQDLRITKLETELEEIKKEYDIVMTQYFNLSLNYRKLVNSLPENIFNQLADIIVDLDDL